MYSDSCQEQVHINCSKSEEKEIKLKEATCHFTLEVCRSQSITLGVSVQFLKPLTITIEVL